MEGQAYINNKDIWKTWGAILMKGSYESLLKPAPMKDFIINDSRIENGIRIVANAQNSRLNSRSLTLTIFIEGSNITDYLTKYESFLLELSKGIFILKIPRLKRSYKLVYTDCSNYGNFGERKGKFILKLIEPNPRDRESLE